MELLEAQVAGQGTGSDITNDNLTGLTIDIKLISGYDDHRGKLVHIRLLDIPAVLWRRLRFFCYFTHSCGVNRLWHDPFINFTQTFPTNELKALSIQSNTNPNLETDFITLWRWTKTTVIISITPYCNASSAPPMGWGKITRRRCRRLRHGGKRCKRFLAGNKEKRLG